MREGLQASPLGSRGLTCQSSLRYSFGALEETSGSVRRLFPDMPILLGGAIGYLPDTVTPEGWARMAVSCAQGRYCPA